MGFFTGSSAERSAKKKAAIASRIEANIRTGRSTSTSLLKRYEQENRISPGELEPSTQPTSQSSQDSQVSNLTPEQQKTKQALSDLSKAALSGDKAKYQQAQERVRSELAYRNLAPQTKSQAVTTRNTIQQPKTVLQATREKAGYWTPDMAQPQSMKPTTGYSGSWKPLPETQEDYISRSSMMAGAILSQQAEQEVVTSSYFKTKQSEAQSYVDTKVESTRARLQAQVDAGLKSPEEANRELKKRGKTVQAQAEYKFGKDVSSYITKEIEPKYQAKAKELGSLIGTTAMTKPSASIKVETEGTPTQLKWIMGEKRAEKRIAEQKDYAASQLKAIQEGTSWPSKIRSKILDVTNLKDTKFGDYLEKKAKAQEMFQFKTVQAVGTSVTRKPITTAVTLGTLGTPLPKLAVNALGVTKSWQIGLKAAKIGQLFVRGGAVTKGLQLAGEIGSKDINYVTNYAEMQRSMNIGRKAEEQGKGKIKNFIADTLPFGRKIPGLGEKEKFRTAVAQDLYLRGYSPSEAKRKADELVRMRGVNIFAKGIGQISSELTGEFGGDIIRGGTKASAVIYSKTFKGFAKNFGTGFYQTGLAGIGEASTAVLTEGITSYRTPSLKEYGIAGGVGFLTAGTVGGFIKGGKGAIGTSKGQILARGFGRGAQVGSYTTDLGEGIGDITANLIRRATYPSSTRIPVFTTVPSFTQTKQNTFTSSQVSVPTQSPTFTLVNTPSFTNVRTNVPTSSFTNVPSNTNINSFTNIFSNVNTNVNTNTNTLINVDSNINSNINTNIFTNVNTNVNVPTNTFVNVPTFTPRDIFPILPIGDLGGGGGFGFGGRSKSPKSRYSPSLLGIELFKTKGLTTKQLGFGSALGLRAVSSKFSYKTKKRKIRRKR